MLLLSINMQLVQISRGLILKTALVDLKSELKLVIKVSWFVSHC